MVPFHEAQECGIDFLVSVNQAQQIPRMPLCEELELVVSIRLGSETHDKIPSMRLTARTYLKAGCIKSLNSSAASVSNTEGTSFDVSAVGDAAELRCSSTGREDGVVAAGLVVVPGVSEAIGYTYAVEGQVNK